MANDAELARRGAAGDREAVGAIFDRYAPLLRAILLDAAGSLPEADDLLQEVFVRACRSLGQLQAPERLGAWLVGIARRQGHDFRRKAARRRRRFVPLIGEPEAAVDEAPSEAVDLVRRAIAELPERERMAVHIHYLAGEPAELAREALGLSASGFYKLLERARGRLQKRLVQIGVR
jgi:RNA polymerase sigma-70 factor, ECF subfamily